MLQGSNSDQSIAADVTAIALRDLIEQQLEEIITSAEFLATAQQRDFLSFVVRETLAGRSDSLKGYTIATQVFKRADDFNASVDPIVSIQANKLRRALERYYLIDGKHAPLRVEIPKGTYVPTFIRQDIAEMSPTQDSSTLPPIPEDN